MRNPRLLRKGLIVLALFTAGCSLLPGCYLSRQVAGDELVGGPTNPALWVTVPVDTLLFPFELAHFVDRRDSWCPWSADDMRAQYVDKYKFPGE